MHHRKYRELSLRIKLLMLFGGAGVIAAAYYDFTHRSRDLFSNRVDFNMFFIGVVSMTVSVVSFFRKKKQL